MTVETRTAWLSRRRRRGTALLEFVMSVPLFALIIMLTFFFGWSMTNQQHVKASSRYVTWRSVLTGSGASSEELNRLFFQDQAPQDENYRTSRGGGPSDALEGLVAASGSHGADVEELARRLVMETFPRGRSTGIAVRFETSIDAWRQFTGRIHSRHTREGVEWRHREARVGGVLTEQFLFELDETLNNVPAPGDRLGRMFATLYRRL